MIDPRPKRRLDRGMKATLFALFIGLFVIGCGQDPLHEAAERGDLEQIESQIALGAEIDSQNGKDGETPLHRAATRGQLHAAKLLIAKGAKVNIGRTKDEKTALDLAEDCAFFWRNKNALNHNEVQHVEVANLLISNGGVRSDGTHYGWFENNESGVAWKLRFKDGRIIKAETWKPTGEPCYWTQKGIGVVHFYNEDGTKWRIDFYKRGKIVSRKYQRKGSIHGPWTTWYENRQKSSEENYKNGKIHGIWTKWRIDGQKSFEKRYKEGKRHGVENTWYPSGQMAMESKWKDDQLISSVAWKPNGQKCPDTNVQDRDGIIVRYYEDGKKEFRNTYKDGMLNGLSTGWYKNGQKESEWNYKDGKRDGLSTNWYENGQKEDESSFKEGKRDGFWIKYNIDGKEIFRKTYKNSEEVKDFGFDPQLLPANLR